MMTTKTKIIIIVLIILALIVGIFGIYKSTLEEQKKGKRKDQIEYMSDLIENTVSTPAEANVMQKNEIIENVIEDTTNAKTSTSSDSTFIGREEQESSAENTGTNDEEKAIELAKKEWGISVDSYSFNASRVSDGVFVVYVINKTNTRTEMTYTVNIKTGAVTEK